MSGDLKEEVTELREGGRKMEFRLEHWLLLVAVILAIAAGSWVYYYFKR